jgi:hypothetical protein
MSGSSRSAPRTGGSDGSRDRDGGVCGRLEGMAHLPVNHPARPFLRFVAGLIGLYILVFGIVGVLETWDGPFFGREETWVLGLRTNPAFSVLSICTGAVLLAAVLIGRNIDHFMYLAAAGLFLTAGIVKLMLLRTDANFLNFHMVNVIVSFLFGLVLLEAGLYGKVGPRELAEAEEHRRRSGAASSH